MSVSLDFPAVLCTGVDPLVMGRSQDPLQRYFAHMTVALEGAVLLLIVLHAMGLERVWGFQRLAPLDRPWIDETGLVLGLLGLALCRAAQATMGNSWRVGIDETRPTGLIETGVFRYIRNPTYTGLFTMILGLWIIWPTAFITLFGVLFVVLLEVQVRSEERFLLDQHGERYAAYRARTKRHVPCVY
jgi:protein-S-isoprenylcysteine O-methyltransferase Ste14